MSLLLKDPQARVDHAIDWSAYLAGQSLIASDWTVEPEEAGFDASLFFSCLCAPGRTACHIDF